MPCYNEADTIGEVASRVLASPYTAELIIVDDGSTDGTLYQAKAIDDPRVRVLAQPGNQGKGAALRRGFAIAGEDYVIVQDADLEYDPQEYGDLLAPLLQNKADVVYGSRFLTGRPHRVLYFWHAVGNRILTTASNMFTNLNLTDMETCYKAFRREVIEGINIEEDRFGFEPEITAKVAQGGWRIFEIGISYTGRTYAEGKKIGWKDGIWALRCVIRYSSIGNRFRGLVGYVSPASGTFEDGRRSAPVADDSGVGAGGDPVAPDASSALALGRWRRDTSAVRPTAPPNTRTTSAEARNRVVP
jgi:glycosyltransferase involved in cell wall biosynthesis